MVTRARVIHRHSPASTKLCFNTTHLDMKRPQIFYSGLTWYRASTQYACLVYCARRAVPRLGAAKETPMLRIRCLTDKADVSEAWKRGGLPMPSSAIRVRPDVQVQPKIDRALDRIPPRLYWSVMEWLAALMLLPRSWPQAAGSTRLRVERGHLFGSCGRRMLAGQGHMNRARAAETIADGDPDHHSARYHSRFVGS